MPASTGDTIRDFLEEALVGLKANEVRTMFYSSWGPENPEVCTFMFKEVEVYIVNGVVTLGGVKIPENVLGNLGAKILAAFKHRYDANYDEKEAAERKRRATETAERQREEQEQLAERLAGLLKK